LIPSSKDEFDQGVSLGLSEWGTTVGAAGDKLRSEGRPYTGAVMQGLGHLATELSEGKAYGQDVGGPAEAMFLTMAVPYALETGTAAAGSTLLRSKNVGKVIDKIPTPKSSALTKADEVVEPIFGGVNVRTPQTLATTGGKKLLSTAASKAKGVAQAGLRKLGKGAEEAGYRTAEAAQRAFFKYGDDLAESANIIGTQVKRRIKGNKRKLTKKQNRTLLRTAAKSVVAKKSYDWLKDD
jgi:hypothetical protein